jgi:uncharacterized repeat protein (TIGR02543 family)
MTKNHKTRIFSIVLILMMLLGALGTPTSTVQAAGVTLENNPTVLTFSSTTSNAISFSHTTGTGGDRLLLVGVSWNSNTNDSPITSVTFTYGASIELPLDYVISRKYASNYRFAAIYSLANPPSGETGTVKVTFGNSVGSGIVAGAANFIGVDTITPLGTPNGADGSGTAVSVTLNGLAGDELVFDTLFVGGTSTSATAGAGQTQLVGWNAFTSPARGAASIEQASGSSVEMDWTTSNSIWVDVAVPIFPACTGERYTLTAGDDGHGTVALNPAGGSYCSGRSVTLTPVADPGYQFSGWVGPDAGDVIPTDGIYMIVMNGNKSVTANFAAQACQDISLTVEDDTYLSGATGAGSYNYGGATTIQVDRGTSTSRRTTLLRWDVSSIPANAIVSSANIQLQVTDASTYAYPMYDVVKDWVEGTNDGVAGTGASWSYYDAGITAWGTAGASATTGDVDRGVTNLWSTTNASFTPVGSKTVALNADGVDLVQRWVDGSTNNGVIIQDYTGSTNTLYFDSAEGTTPPQLNINYCLPDNTPPGQPVLVSPAPTGATDVSTYPTLEVTVSDPDENATDVTFYGREAGDSTWLELGTAYLIASGENATMAWPGRSLLTEYEWYVAVDDGVATIDGPTWTFTTVAPPNHTVTFDANLGSGTMAPQIANVPTPLTLNTFTRTGYSFSGWNTQADGLGTAYADGATYAFDLDITLYAQWEALPTYTIFLPLIKR